MSEYAPEYSRRERVILIARHLAWLLPLFAVTKYWFFPWLDRYVGNAHCYDYGWVTGVELVYYGIFVGLPLHIVLVFLFVEGRRSYKVIRVGQNPLPGEKVFKPTKYSYGVRAKIKPYLFFMVMAFLIGLSIRGIFWANDIANRIEHENNSKCLSE